ncbi:MAG: hypothetical protein AAF358_09890 [Pseudomonadota bacterium]
MKFTNTVFMALLLQAFVGVTAQAAEDPAEAFRESYAQTQERLQLTDEQKQQVEPILRARFDASRSVMEKYGMSPDGAGQGKPSRREMRSMAKELKPIREKADQELAEILTDEQLDEYREIQEESRTQMRERMKSRRGGR